MGFYRYYIMKNVHEKVTLNLVMLVCFEMSRRMMLSVKELTAQKLDVCGSVRLCYAGCFIHAGCYFPLCDMDTLEFFARRLLN